MNHIATDIEAAVVLAMSYIQTFVAEYVPKEKVDGQVTRVARKFGLVAAAGEMAITFGILPWLSGEAMTAAGQYFQDWLGARGTSGSLEEEHAVAHVRAFIEENGSTRFVELDKDFDVMSLPVQRRVGVILRDSNKNREFCFFSEMWQKEICKGRDRNLVARALKARDLLVTGNDGRLNKVVRTKDKSYRMYVVKEAILLEPPEHKPEASNLAGFFDDQLHQLSK